MNSFARHLVDNLKQLNAKERDHLMRYVYLGFAEAYAAEDMVTWLSDRFSNDLRTHYANLGLGPQTRCVFAGMDYHLDWLYAALLLARAGKLVAECDEVREMPAIDDLDESLWPVSGRHEDVDLLLVLTDDINVAVLLVEAKGIAAFDKVQLARKAIRVHYILEHSGARAQPDLVFRFVFMAPNKPEITDICQFVEHHKKSPELDTLKMTLPAIREATAKLGTMFLKIPGFPAELIQVKRVDPDETYQSPRKKRYRRWQLQRRPIRLSGKPRSGSGAPAGANAPDTSQSPETTC